MMTDTSYASIAIADYFYTLEHYVNRLAFHRDRFKNRSFYFKMLQLLLHGDFRKHDRLLAKIGQRHKKLTRAMTPNVVQYTRTTRYRYQLGIGYCNPYCHLKKK